MDEYKRALDNVEEILRRMQGLCKFQKTASPDIFCSTLPIHWRSNKTLPCQFSVLILYPVDDGTKVTVVAGNEENPWADVKNNVAEVQQQIARFSDLRFLGKSGRGKNFNLTITIHKKSMKEVATVNGVIKVTVDGPRDSRNPNKHMMADPRKRPNNSLGYIPPFLPLKQPRLMPPGMFPLLPASIAPSSLHSALQNPQNAPSLPPHLSQLFNLPTIFESYKAAMMQNPDARLPNNFPSVNFLPNNPLLMQQLGTMLGLKDLITNGKCQDQLKSPNSKLEKSTNKVVRKYDSPISKLPASSEMPSPCFRDKKPQKAPTIGEEDSKTRLDDKIDLLSPNETLSTTLSTSTSYLSTLREEDVPIDVETTTDDDDHAMESKSEDDQSKKDIKPVIKLWRPYTPPTSTSPNNARLLKEAESV